ncbi:hypothetical protein CRG98_015238 [Punica granatum]|uniref:Zinc finger PHD-type domain-containing protein n=1 Tax=Punica granatum TaxID=22663 RepID=A0A2I0K752_PUNGR|nr:hypothetical protein CRG98_015238 [Punica granatum]
MKGRSQRLQTANPPDDWVDGSWTVDCICGVNFDDGEEMVKCDECGVWVHTRCSRYVKEEELFACDKCKNKNNKTDIEETEVAQFLVELPTKTVRIESNYAATGSAKRPPFRIWTENPMEEKVHVQGIPGGDPGLFSGLSSVFSQQLWKCTGYVPKKFNFQYKEFPCWDSGKEDVANVEEDSENAADKGAGVLFSLSKESVLASPVTAIMRTRTKVDDVSNDRKARSKETKKSEKEESGMSKDISGKKKARIIDNDLDTKKRAAHASKAVFTPTSDAKQLEFYEARGARSFKTDIRSVKNRNLRDTVAVEPTSDCRIAVSKTDEIPKNDVAATMCVPEGSLSELTNHDQDVLVKDKIPHNVSGVNGSAEEGTSGGGCNGTDSVCEMKVGESCATDDSNGRSFDKLLDLPEKCKADASPEIKDSQTSSAIITDKSLGFPKPNVKIEVHDDSEGLLKNLSASLPDANSLKMSPDTAKSTGVVSEDISGHCKANDMVVSSLQCGFKKSVDVTLNEGESSENKGQKDVDFSVNHNDHKEEANGSEGSNVLCKSLSEPKHASGDEELSKSGGGVSSAAPSSRLKVAVSLGKSSPTVSSIVISKSSSSNKSNPSDSRNTLPAGNQPAADSKDHASNDTTTDEGKRDAMRKTEKERSSRIFHTSVPKRNASDSKDCAVSSTSKSSSAQNVSTSLGSADSTRTLQNQSALPAQNRASTSGLHQKVGKSNHAAIPPSSKGSHSAAAHQPVSNSPAALSDEELALLLHQELNSSPRVPRVPRVRQANLPQLASQAASTLHIKRTSSSGTKDQNLIPKRKGRDSAKESATCPREVEDEAKKTSRATSSSDQRRQDRPSSGDACTREAKGSPAHVHSLNARLASLSTSANSGPSSSNEANDVKRPARLTSPMSNSDDDFTTDQPPVYRTLPGLINEIMSKGRRMTYEELCDAVLPHWPSLRKHNGERYAYSSHSQAVLDCLRNRQEWAQLVDRGPKSNSSRKRRRVDSQDFEDDEDSKQRTSRDMESKRLKSQRDDFPKGKRQARRRRLALQGRDVKDLRSRRKADMLTDDDDGAFSNSTEDSIFTEEDEIQGGGGGDDSSGSDEVNNS